MGDLHRVGKTHMIKCNNPFEFVGLTYIWAELVKQSAELTNMVVFLARPLQVSNLRAGDLDWDPTAKHVIRTNAPAKAKRTDGASNRGRRR